MSRGSRRSFLSTGTHGSSAGFFWDRQIGEKDILDWLRPGLCWRYIIVLRLPLLYDGAEVDTIDG